MANAIFRFFEVVADELCTQDSKVINRTNTELDDSHSGLFEDLQAELKVTSSQVAIESAVNELRAHFQVRGAHLPFLYDPPTGRFTALDPPYLQFTQKMSEIRSLGTRSSEFELMVMERLSLRATGSLHRVGFPRSIKKKTGEFNAHLRDLGFNGKVLFGKEKDGGFDILWALPIGAHPHRPLVSVQCKNGLYDLGEAHKSVGTGGQSLAQHLGLQTSVHVPCVLFNDYLTKEQLGPKQLSFVPLRLSDLSQLQEMVRVEAL